MICYAFDNYVAHIFAHIHGFVVNPAKDDRWH